jgi:isochorismate synthase
MQLVSSTTTDSLCLAQAWQQAIESNYAVAMYKLPNTQSIQFVADTSGRPKLVEISFEDNVKGFCIAAFNNTLGNEAELIKPDIAMNFALDGQLVAKQSLDNTNSFATTAFLDKARRQNSVNLEKKSIAKTNSSAEETNHFENMVASAISQIEEGSLQKVVLSRKKTYTISNGINVPEIIFTLIEKYPKAFTCAVYLPAQEIVWLGASPELLMSISDTGLFKTMALAGTQTAIATDGSTIGSGQALWSQKEIEEQALVSRYIIDCLKKVRVREFKEIGPKTVQAGNLLHLQTEYIVDTTAIDFEPFGTVMLQLLNPTSAVCGMPKAAALDFIKNNENYQREYYSGFWGPKNMENESQFFVNLRCMKQQGNSMSFFAGAGITEDSQPARELRETELKIDTLLSLFDDKL